MRAAILSNDENLISLLKNYTDEYAIRKFIIIETSVFRNLKMFLNSHMEFDIIIVDNFPGKRSSTETAKLVRVKHPYSALILLSSNPDNVYEAFAVKAHRFFLKPISKDMICEAIEAFRKDQCSYKFIVAKIGNSFRAFSTGEIMYIAAEGKSTMIYTKREALQTSTPYHQILSQLPEEYFFKCHRSFTVNMGHIREFSFEYIYLTDNTVLPLSRRRKMDFCIKFNEFVKSHTF